MRNVLRRRYLRSQGYYYCAVERGTSGLRGDFPFKHKAVAERVVLYRRRRTGSAWGLYRYGSRGDAEMITDVTERFVELCDMPPDPLPLDVIAALHDAPTLATPLASPLASRRAARRTPVGTAERASDRDWERRAVVAEAIALERAHALADVRATLALTQTLLRAEETWTDGPTVATRRSDGPTPAFNASPVRSHHR